MPKTLFVGHSLVNDNMPEMLDRLMSSRTVDYQVINGASLAFNWQDSWNVNHSPSPLSLVRAREVLPSGNYDNLILTEQIAYSGDMAGNFDTLRTRTNAMKFADLAWDANPRTRVMIYETWGYMNNEATWRANIKRDHAAWEGVADYLSARNPASAPDVVVVPAGQALGRLYDNIEAGRGAGFDSIRDIFSTGDPWSQTIHMNHAGNYFVALVQYATINGSSPVGLGTTVANPWGVPYTGWTPLQATLMQHIAWETVAQDGDIPLHAGEIKPVLRVGSSRAETLSGGNGDDRLYGWGGNDRLNAGSGDDLAFGSGGNDWLYGGNGRDWLLGGNNADHLLGESGNDRLYGGDGSDQLSGGIGNDILTGDDGADRFVFRNGGDADRITDFDRGEGDKLLLSSDLWTGTRTAQQIADSAQSTSAGLVLNFGGGDTLTLVGIHSTAGLAAAIEII